MYWVSIGHYEAKQLVIDDTGSVEGILAQSGDQDRYHGCLTDGLTLKDRATQLQEGSSRNAIKLEL